MGLLGSGAILDSRQAVASVLCPSLPRGHSEGQCANWHGVIQVSIILANAHHTRATNADGGGVGVLVPINVVTVPFCVAR